MSETNGNSKLGQLLPGAVGEKEEVISLLTPDGDESGVAVVFSNLDGHTKTRYDRIIQTAGKRGRLNFDAGNFLVFDAKCKRIEGLSAEDCDGMEPKEYFRNTENGHILLNIAVNEYLNRFLPSAGDRSKSQ
jgi:hypothetical protein